MADPVLWVVEILYGGKWVPTEVTALTRVRGLANLRVRKEMNQDNKFRVKPYVRREGGQRG